MKNFHASILINAGKEKVWETMLGEESYKIWTREFQKGSYYEGSWTEGSEIKFVAPDINGELQGMYGRIKDYNKFNFTSIEFHGLIVYDKIDTTSVVIHY